MKAWDHFPKVRRTGYALRGGWCLAEEVER